VNPLDLTPEGKVAFLFDRVVEKGIPAENARFFIWQANKTSWGSSSALPPAKVRSRASTSCSAP